MMMTMMIMMIIFTPVTLTWTLVLFGAKTTFMVNPCAIEERAGERRIQFIVCNEIALNHNVSV